MQSKFIVSFKRIQQLVFMILTTNKIKRMFALNKNLDLLVVFFFKISRIIGFQTKMPNHSIINQQKIRPNSMSEKINFDLQFRKILRNVRDDPEELTFQEIFGCSQSIITCPAIDQCNYIVGKNSSENSIMNENMETEPFIKKESTDNFYLLPNEISIMNQIKKKGPLKIKATNQTRKLCNGHKWDYRHFLRRWKKYAKFYFQDKKQLAKACRVLMGQVGTRMTTTQDITKLFANEESDSLIEMSFLNSAMLSSILKLEMAVMLFQSKKLGNKKTFYLHVINKYMRLQSISLAGRLQAR